MEIKEKPICKFGATCYRKNPRHLEAYSHPKELNTFAYSTTPDYDLPPAKKHKVETLEKNQNVNFKNKDNTKLKQTTLHFVKEVASKPDSSKGNNECDNQLVEDKNKLRVFSRKRGSKKIVLPKKDMKHDSLTGGKKAYKPQKNTNNSETLLLKEEKNTKKRTQKSEDNSENETAGNHTISESDEDNSTDTEQSTSWVFVKKPSTQVTQNNIVEDFTNNFFDFCKNIDSSSPENALSSCGLKLVGPFDVFAGDKNYQIDKELALCHWRFYYDPPEFQTVLASNSGFHIGYWRDDPQEQPVFLASNNADKDCMFKEEAENIFGAVFHYLTQFIKTCDPFNKIKITKLQNALSEWSEKNKYSLEKKSNKMLTRQKKVVSKTFHKMGIVVPVQAKTELGYRPLIETEANLKRICKLIMQADDDGEKEALFENLQPLITAANIANDECDFGNSLELGIDLFCMGSPVFHETIEHLLTTAYSLLNRTEYERIIKAHLKNRRKSTDLAVF